MIRIDPKTGREVMAAPSVCVLHETKNILCDDYLKEKEDGTYERDFSCCEKCGWNPDVHNQRVRKLHLTKFYKI